MTLSIIHILGIIFTIPILMMRALFGAISGVQRVRGEAKRRAEPTLTPWQESRKRAHMRRSWLAVDNPPSPDDLGVYLAEADAEFDRSISKPD